MTYRFVAALFAVLTLAIAGCRNVEEHASPSQGTPEELRTNTDTTVTTTGSTGGTVSALSPSDKEFVMSSAQASLAEVQLGLLAGRKSTNSHVKTFGRRLVEDHGKTIEELRKLVTAKGLALPSEPTADHVKAGQDLSAKSGAAFDRDFMAHMVSDHEKTVAMFDEAARTAQDAEVKAFAASKLPVLQEHLRMAKETQTKL